VTSYRAKVNLVVCKSVEDSNVIRCSIVRCTRFTTFCASVPRYLRMHAVTPRTG
jgi:hypothetical protein